jgi:hypothetical protein
VAKVLWQGGFCGGPDWGAGDAEILRQAAEKRAERDRAALAYQAAVDQRNLGYGIAAVAALALVALWGSRSYRANKGHRVPRNRTAKIQVFASGGRGLGSRVASAAWSAGATGQIGGSGGNVTDTFKVPMAKASVVMSKLRRKFAREIASGKLRLKLVREGKWPRGRRIGKGA